MEIDTTTPETASEAEPWKRSKSRMSRTVCALMRRGIDSATAKELEEKGHTLSSLQQLSEVELLNLSLNEECVGAIRRGARPEIPPEILAKVLWANRWTCCVCRKSGLAVIAHHINQWSVSRDHSCENLAIVCLEHHAKAHTKGSLEQNLTPERIQNCKEQWETEVSSLDAKAILEASRLSNSHWLWFNHSRLFEMAEAIGVELTKLPGFRAALSTDLVDAQGAISSKNNDASYLYAGGGGAPFSRFVKEVLQAVLLETSIFNVSDDLDPGFLSSVASPGDIIFLQGRHFFRSLNKRESGLGQASEVRRQANQVRFSFTIDRWEAVANSAWAVWLRGTQRISAILRIANISREGRYIHLQCTGLAVATYLEGLSSRSYAYPTWPQDDEEIDENEEDWLSAEDFSFGADQ